MAARFGTLVVALAGVLCMDVVGPTGAMAQMRNPMIEAVKQRALERRRQQIEQAQRGDPRNMRQRPIWDIPDPAIARRRNDEEIVDRPVGPTLFLPENAKELAAYIDARKRLDQANVSDCADDIQRRVPNTAGRDYATQMRAADRVRELLAECNTDKNRLENETLGMMRGELVRWAAAQPTSPKGLEAINTAWWRYQGEWSRVAGGSRAYGVAIGILSARRDAIETAIRPELIAGINRADEPLSIDDMFSADPGHRENWRAYYVDADFLSRVPRRADGARLFWETADLKWQSPREGSGRIAVGEPTGEEMAYAMLRTFAAAGGRKLAPYTVSLPNFGNRFGSSALDSIVPITLQIHDLRKITCRPQGGGYRCSYRVWTRVMLPNQLASDPIWSMFYNIANSGYGGRAETLFMPGAGGWRMPELDAGLLQGQTTQLQGLSNFLGAAADAGGNAIGVMTNATSGGGRGRGGKSQADEEREERVRAAEEKARRRR